MTALLKALKTLKPWQVSVLVAVLVAAAGGTFGIYALAGSSGGVSLGEDQQLIPVRLGDLVNQVSTNGSLVFPNRETLTFGSQGTVKELLVDEGQQVVEGQVLARLDRSTIASLEKAVVQAQVDLRDAQDELALAKDPHTLLDIAQAEANVANAELSLHNTQEAFDRLLEPTSQDVTQAEAAVSNAKLSLKTAQEALVDLLERTPQETAQAETAVTNARLAVQDAQETLDEVKEGPTSGDLSEARVRVESAITNQANAQGDLKLIRREWNDKEQAAQDVFETALEGYQGVFRKWLGIELSEAETDMDPGALLASWSADLTSPMTGFVSMVEVEAGQTVTANTTIVEIVESTVIEVDAIVDEIDVLFVREGAQAQVTMDALPGQVLRGTVSSIAPAARNQQGVVSYPISIRLDAPEGAQLVEGLSATASIVIREDTDVLLVPNQSIYGSFEQPVIRVMKNGTIEDRPVTLGNSDDFWTVVIEGLQEGDQVVIETSGVSTDPFAQIRQQFQSGGRRGGGGFLGGDGRRR